MNRVLLVRLKPGVMGEADRVVHVVAAGELRAYCGLRIEPGTADALPGLSGQPCFLCLMTAPVES